MGLGIRNVRERQVEVSRVRVVQKLSYAEAVKKVEEDGSRGMDPEKSGVSSRSVPVQRDKPKSDICQYDWIFNIYSDGYQLYCRDGP